MSKTKDVRVFEKSDYERSKEVDYINEIVWYILNENVERVVIDGIADMSDSNRYKTMRHTLNTDKNVIISKLRGIVKMEDLVFREYSYNSDLFWSSYLWDIIIKNRYKIVKDVVVARLCDDAGAGEIDLVVVFFLKVAYPSLGYSCVMACDESTRDACLNLHNMIRNIAKMNGQEGKGVDLFLRRFAKHFYVAFGCQILGTST